MAREGTAVILSVSTSRDETLVTVPDWTVRPGEEGGMSRTPSAGGASTGREEGGGATPPTELVLIRDRGQDSTHGSKLLGFFYRIPRN